MCATSDQKHLDGNASQRGARVWRMHQLDRAIESIFYSLFFYFFKE
jgi:hypothetical protein